MNHIKLFEEFKIKPRAVDVPVYSTGQRPVNIDNKKVTRKQDIIVATDETIGQIVGDEIDRLGKDADLNHINVSQVTNMNSLFYDTGFEGDISKWNVSNVEDMNDMFRGCSNFNCDLSKWDVSKVTDMCCMFSWCASFNQDLSSWDVRNVTNMRWMFEGCTKFNQDLSSWNVSNVENRAGFADYCPLKKEYKPKFK